MISFSINQIHSEEGINNGNRSNIFLITFIVKVWLGGIEVDGSTNANKDRKSKMKTIGNRLVQH